MVTLRNRKTLRVPVQAILLLCFFLISYLFVRSAGADVVAPETVAEEVAVVVQEAPQFIDFSPVLAKPGMPVTVRGKHFTNAIVRSDCAMVISHVVSDSVIQIEFPATCNSSYAMVVISNDAGQIQFQIPYDGARKATVNSLLPISGTKNTWITLRGRDFSNVKKLAFTNKVYGKTYVDSVAIANDSVIYAEISSKSNWGRLVLEYKDGTSSTYENTFSYAGENPEITSYTGDLVRGSRITINGANLSPALLVFFGREVLTDLTIVSDSKIEATMAGVKGYNGFLNVETRYGTDSIATPQPPPPYAVPEWFFPASGKTGDTIDIHGYDLDYTTGVKFGDVPAASFRTVGDFLIRAVVGAGATGNIALTAQGGGIMRTSAVFTYTAGPKPEITSFTPTQGYEDDSVIIRGTGFTGATAAFIGGVPVQYLYVYNDSTVGFHVGKGATGTVKIVTPSGTDTSRSVFTYLYSKPLVSSFYPVSATRGDKVTIEGSKFSDVKAVYFGGVPADSFRIVYAYRIQAWPAKGASGSVTVESDAGRDSLAGFTFIKPKPDITGLYPFIARWGDTIRISGTYLEGATAVSIGGVSADGFMVYGDSLIIARVANNASNEDAASTIASVVVTTPYGKDSVTGLFIYKPPVVRSVVPAAAAVDETVTITGENFSTASAVSFGGVPARSFTVVSATVIKAMVGAGATGKIAVVGLGGIDSSASFIYQPPQPVVLNFVPKAGGTGDTIIVYGDRFRNITAVKFGSVPATILRTLGDSLIYVVLKNGASGAVEVVSSYGTDTLGGFVFRDVKPAVTSFNPASGYTGDSVMVNGKRFTGATQVTLGGVAAQSFQVYNDSTLLLIVGRGTTGKVAVTTPAGSGASAGNFGYVAPHIVVTAFEPASAGKGDTVLIAGSGFRGAAEVTFGIIAADSFRVLNDKVIKAWVGNGRSGSVRVVSVSRGEDSVSGFTWLPAVSLAPQITGFAPASVNVGDTVNIYGKQLLNVTRVYLNSAAQYRIVNDTLIKAVAMLSSNNGYIYVYSDYGADTSATRLIVTDGKPDILSFTPATAKAGGIVSIYGNNFSNITGVSFGGVPADSFRVISAQEIRAWVGSGRSGVVTVTGTKGVDSAAGFTWLPVVKLVPQITSYGPGEAGAGTTITIKGLHFTGTTAVSLGSAAAAGFVVVSDSLIHAVVASNAATTPYSIIVTTPNGKDTAFGFVVLARPVVASVTPAAAAIGDTVVIAGTALKNTTAVYFGNKAAASFTVGADLKIRAVVGNGETGRITVVTPGGRDTSKFFTYLPPAPLITGFAPSSVSVGDTVSIYGRRLQNVTEVFLNSAAQYRIINDTLIKAVAMLSSNNGYIYVYNNYGGDTSATRLIVADNRPRISSFTPTTAYKGDVVSIFGSSFSNITGVSFGGVAADSFRVISVQEIRAWVGNGRSGMVKVTGTKGVDSATGFTWAPAIKTVPRITSYAPGEAGAGATVTIKGLHFTGATAVSLGSAAADGFVVISDSVIHAVVAGNAGTTPYSIIVTTPNGKDTASGFVVLARPVVASVTPAAATMGDTVVITGTALTNATAVYFGNKAAASFTIGADRKIRAVVGNGETGRVTVVTTGGRDTSKFFTYLPPAPLITGFAPASVTIGDTVNIYGKRFLNVTQVYLNAAAPYRVINDTLIKAVALLSLNNGYIYVYNNYGGDTSATRLVVTEPKVLPEITSYAPTAASPGKTVVIKGKRLSGAIAVRLGGELAASFSIVSDSVIHAVVANNANNQTGYIIVTTPAGKDTAYGFTVLPPAPAVTSVTPAAATVGETVVIQGSNLAGASSVRFGNRPAASFRVASSTTIYAVVDSGATGKVTVVTPNGTDTTALFTYLQPAPQVLYFAPATARTGDTVTIWGKRFSSILSVKFGGVDVRSYQTVNDTLIKAVVGFGATGNVSVITAYGVAQLGGFQYPGLPPAIYDFTPKSAAKGQTVRIWGTHLTGCTEVKLGSYKAASYVIESDSVIKAVIGEGDANDVNQKVSLVTPGGNAALGNFSYIPAGVFNISGFKAVLVNDKVQVSWQTNKEKNTDYFMLTWTAGSETILQNKVPAAGFSDSVVSYAFTWPVTKAGVNLVELRTHDKLGNEAFGDTASFTVDAEKFASVGTYPNPAINSTTVQHPASASSASIMMFNMNGVLVRTQTVKAGDVQTTVIFNSMPKGMYKLVWTNGSTSKSVTLMLQ